VVTAPLDSDASVAMLLDLNDNFLHISVENLRLKPEIVPRPRCCPALSLWCRQSSVKTRGADV